MTELETLLLNSLHALDTESRERETLLLQQLNDLNETLAHFTTQLNASELRIDSLTQKVDDLTNLLEELGITP